MSSLDAVKNEPQNVNITGIYPRILFQTLGAVLFLLFGLFGCSKSPDHAPLQTVQSKEHPPLEYISKGDLDQIRSRKTLRFLVPRFDGADALPRDGIPVQQYQSLADKFASSLGLEAQWVFVDAYDDLIPALTRGEGDIVVTNMGVTKRRKEQIAFSKPLAQVSEVLVSRSEDVPSSLDNIAPGSIVLAEGTAYIESLERKYPDVSYQTLPSDTSDADLLAGVSEGRFFATIVDSDIARKLLSVYEGLATSIVINKSRSIAWPVRKENTALLKKLNEFLVSHHVKSASNVNEKRDWSAIRQKGRLRMLTLNNPASYFMWRGQLMGFDYELMNKFAKEHSLHLSVVLHDSIPELFAALARGEGDVIAASITRNAQREREGLVFSKPYLKVSELFVSAEKANDIIGLDQLTGKTIGINPATVFYNKLVAFQDAGAEFFIKQIPDASTEELISRLGEGEFDLTMADSHLVAIEQAYHQNIHVNFSLPDQASIAWGLREDQVDLKTQLDAFISKQYRGLFYNVVYKKYFKDSRKIHRFQGGRVSSDGVLSPFDDLVKAQAQRFNMDWRLVVAQMYQESKFKADAKSFAGAEGLMQVLPRTAAEFGFDQLSVPENGIAAGVEYMHWLEKRFPGELDVQERIYFTLAAYNAGTGHVRDARRLAGQLGYDQNKWFDHVEKAMLLLAKPEYYKKARFGYVRGREPVTYVRNIRDIYLGFVNAQ